MTKDRSKKEQRRLRELAATAYEREMNGAAEGLLKQFERWKNKQIDVFELNDKIHEFHNGISRDLYRRYTGEHPELSVAIALNRGILSREEIGEELLLSVEGIATLFHVRDPQ